MTIVLTGGGSGGHITPILAVADEIKKIHPEARLIYIGQKGDPIGEVPKQSALIDECHYIHAGKFRRYHSEGLKQLFDLKTLLLNVRDAFYLILGVLESFFLMGRLHPDVAFTPGGFVGVPVGMVANWKHVPFVTHDLDALPGLANRINARHAAVHAVAMPVELYPYPKDKTVYVGVPTARDYVSVDANLMNRYRQEAGLSAFDKVLFVIGGGLGAQRLNEAVMAISSELLGVYPGLVIVHAAGRLNESQVSEAYNKLLAPAVRPRVIVKGFLNDVFRYSGAADLIITRAGATNMAEFAVQNKPCIVVPNPLLTGGHQTKNAEHLANAGAISLVTETEIADSGSVALLAAVRDLLDHPDIADKLARKLGTYANNNAAHELAEIILKQVRAGE